MNVTLGLPLVRTSPDHGTAFDIAGTGRADAVQPARGAAHGARSWPPAMRAGAVRPRLRLSRISRSSTMSSGGGAGSASALGFFASCAAG